MYLYDSNGVEAARVTHMGLAGISRYTIVVAEKERARILQNLASLKTPFRIRGAEIWPCAHLTWSMRRAGWSCRTDAVGSPAGNVLHWRLRRRRMPYCASASPQ